MKDWQLEAMAGAEAAKEWADLNAPEPHEDRLIAASQRLSCAYVCLGDVLDWLVDAARQVKDTPVEPRIMSVINDMEKLNDEIHSMRELYKQGKRE